MSKTILLVATEANWFGTARFPRALSKAGFSVVLLAPQASLAAHSRFVDKVAYLPANANTNQWLHAFAAIVKAVNPVLALPCDDMAYRLMSELVLAPPPHLQAELQRELDDLIRQSLGNPSHYRDSVDKLQLPNTAKALGVRMPTFAHIANLDEAESFASQHQYPVVIKRSQSTGGQGVAICQDAQSLRENVARLLQEQAQMIADFGLPATANANSTVTVAVTAPAPQLLIQAHVSGRRCFYGVTAWQGNILAGMAAECLQANPEPKGPATVLRWFRSDVMREQAALLTKGLGMSGCYSLEFVLSDDLAVTHLLEINRRVGPGHHLGELWGVDHAVALHSALDGEASPTGTDIPLGTDSIRCQFPQEWLRDTKSANLRRYPSDVPWDDPELFEAMIALRDF